MRPVSNIENATLRVPCEQGEYPVDITIKIVDVFSYGRALTRGLVVHKGEIWIVSYGDHGHDFWRLETKVSDVLAHQCGMDFVTWRNYLRRIVRWPWKDEDIQEVEEMANANVGS